MKRLYCRLRHHPIDQQPGDLINACLCGDRALIHVLEGEYAQAAATLRIRAANTSDQCLAATLTAVADYLDTATEGA